MVQANDVGDLTGRDEAPRERPARLERYRLEQIDGELLLFDPSAATVLYCNQSAALVWSLCDGTRTIKDIVTLLAAAFPDARGDVAADVGELVKQLVSRGALVLVP